MILKMLWISLMDLMLVKKGKDKRAGEDNETKGADETLRRKRKVLWYN